MRNGLGTGWQNGKPYVAWPGEPSKKFYYIDGDQQSFEQAETAANDFANAATLHRQKLAGRELTPREVLYGVQLKDSRTLAQKIAAANFKFTADVQLTEAERLLEAATAAAKVEKDNEEYREASDAQRRVIDARRMVEREQAERERAAELKTHLESPLVVNTIAALVDLKDRRRFNDRYEVGDVEEVDRAIRSLQTEPENAKAVIAYVKDLFRRDNVREQMFIEEKKTHLAQMAATLATQQSELNRDKSPERLAAEKLLAGGPAE